MHGCSIESLILWLVELNSLNQANGMEIIGLTSRLATRELVE